MTHALLILQLSDGVSARRAKITSYINACRICVQRFVFRPPAPCVWRRARSHSSIKEDSPIRLFCTYYSAIISTVDNLDEVMGQMQRKQQKSGKNTLKMGKNCPYEVQKFALFAVISSSMETHIRDPHARLSHCMHHVMCLTWFVFDATHCDWLFGWLELTLHMSGPF